MHAVRSVLVMEAACREEESRDYDSRHAVLSAGGKPGQLLDEAADWREHALDGASGGAARKVP